MDARVGRFEGMDPFDADDEQPLTLQRYTYAGADPANNVDPTGSDFGGVDAIVDVVNISATLAGPMGGFGFGSTGGSNLPLDVYLRLFAPWKTFGLGFGGDNRSFTTALSATSRVAARVTLQAPDYHVTSQQAWSSPSHWGIFTAVAKPTIAVSPLASGLAISVAGSNPLLPIVAPDIDAELDLMVFGVAGLTWFDGSLRGDAFPDAEVFATSGGTSRMLLTFPTAGGRNSGPFIHLPGSSTRPASAETSLFISKSSTPEPTAADLDRTLTEEAEEDATAGGRAPFEHPR
jgi:hypothetical protein